jgi:hypothetical protein
VLLHPAVVHLPIAFALFGPPLGLGLWRLTRAHPELHRLRLLLVFWQLALSTTLYAAMFTGEMAADRPDFPANNAELEAHAIHEEIAEWFFLLSLVAIPLAVFAVKSKRDDGILLLILYQTILLGVCIYVGYLGGQITHGS